MVNIVEHTPSSASKTTPKPNVYKELFPYFWPKGETEIKVRIVISLLALLLSKVITVYVPVLYKHIIDALEKSNFEPLWFASTPLMLVLIYAGTRTFANGLQQFRDAIFAKVSAKALRQVALKTFEHVHQLSLRFHLNRKTGGLSRIIDRGTKGIDFLMRMMLFNLVPTALEIALVLGVMVWQFSVLYMITTFSVVAVYVIATYYITEWRTSLRKTMNNADNDATQKAIDSLLNYETVKYFGNDRFESRRYDSSMEKYEASSIRINISLSVLNFVQAIIISAGLLLIMGFSVQDIQAGKQTLGDFVMLNALLIQLYMPLNFLGTVMREIKQATVDMEEMFDLLHQDVEVEDKLNAPALSLTKGEIVFDNVQFAYEPNRTILKGISFTIPAGKTVAVVGSSGAGKSTLSRLLFRFYDVTSGRILIDGQDIRDVSQESLRSYMGIVPQDTVLFNDTLGYNIAYGKPEASSEAVKEAARQAQLTQFLSKLPDGLDTMVGERGLKLSGGEKQRVAIARTLLKNPSILILDEATSALDTATEQEIQEALESIAENRTTLVIAHRLSTIVGADEILVMGDGHILERGKHNELMTLGGIYAQMWLQQLEDQSDPSS